MGQLKIRFSEQIDTPADCQPNFAEAEVAKELFGSISWIPVALLLLDDSGDKNWIPSISESGERW